MNTSKIRTGVMLHIRNNIMLYLMVVFVFITGVAAGGFTVNSVSQERREYLANYLQGYSYMLGNTSQVDSGMIFIRAVLQNAQTAFFIWMFGLTYLSIPLIFMAVALRGFFLGFTVAFLIDYYALNGFFMVLTCVLPQSFIHVPCILVMGVLALQSGIERFKIRKFPHLKRMRFRKLAAYTFKFLAVIAAFFVSGLFDAFVGPLIFKFLLGNMLKMKDFIVLLSNR